MSFRDQSNLALTGLLRYHEAEQETGNATLGMAFGGCGHGDYRRFRGGSADRPCDGATVYAAGTSGYIRVQGT